MDTIASRLILARGRKSRRSFAEEIGVTESTLRNYEQGTSQPSFEALSSISKKLRIRLEWLFFGEGSMYGNEKPFSPLLSPDAEAAESPAVYASEKPSRSADIAVIGLAACGHSGWFIPSPLAIRLALPIQYADNGVFAVVAMGDSMTPAGIRQGFVVYCDPTLETVRDDAVFVEKKDGTVSIKLFVRRDDKDIHLSGWLPPDENGNQKPYTEQVPRDMVAKTACVFLVKRKA